MIESWRRDVAHGDQPTSPLWASIWPPRFARSMTRAFAHWGYLAAGAENRVIDGWLYQRIVPLADPADAKMRIQRCADVVAADEHRAVIHRWEREWRPDLDSRDRRLWATPLIDLDDHALCHHLEAVDALFADAVDCHFMAIGAEELVAELALVARDRLGWDDQRALALVAGTSGISAQLGHDLRAAATAPDRHAALDTYLEQHGPVLTGWDLWAPTLAEQAPFLRRRLHDLPTAPSPPTGAPDADTFPDADVLERARAAYAVRDDTNHRVARAAGLWRLAAREAGRRALADPDDALLLARDELSDALRGVPPGDVVEDRRADVARARGAVPPALVGPPPPPPQDPAGLPEPARRIHQRLGWIVEQQFDPQRSARRQDDTATLTGAPASPGRHRGRARVVSALDEAERLRPGDVLVCTTTSAGWDVLFTIAGAVVTDSGGLMSHPAITARELGVPAVVATGNATTVLADGELVLVDGDHGTVERLSPT